MLHTRHRRLDIVMSRCGAAAINPVAVCRPGPPPPSSIPHPTPPTYLPSLETRPRVPGWRHPHHRYWRHLQLHFACKLHAAASNRGRVRIVYHVLCIVVFVYRIILCIGVVAGDGGMLQVVCCSFYDSITSAGRQLPPRHSPHRLHDRTERGCIGSAIRVT